MGKETILTLKFRGIEALLLDKMVTSGLFNTKSEAIRAALVRYGTELGLLERERLWAEIKKVKRRKVSPDKLKKDLERLEDAS
jgi:Arc/MetJ-type ribon-helix-helix transcriptional regulator